MSRELPDGPQSPPMRGRSRASVFEDGKNVQHIQIMLQRNSKIVLEIRDTEYVEEREPSDAGQRRSEGSTAGRERRRESRLDQFSSGSPEQGAALRRSRTPCRCCDKCRRHRGAPAVPDDGEGGVSVTSASGLVPTTTPTAVRVATEDAPSDGEDGIRGTGPPRTPLSIAVAAAEMFRFRRLGREQSSAPPSSPTSGASGSLDKSGSSSLSQRQGDGVERGKKEEKQRSAMKRSKGNKLSWSGRSDCYQSGRKRGREMSSSPGRHPRGENSPARLGVASDGCLDSRDAPPEPEISQIHAASPFESSCESKKRKKKRNSREAELSEAGANGISSVVGVDVDGGIGEKTQQQVSPSPRRTATTRANIRRGWNAKPSPTATSSKKDKKKKKRKEPVRLMLTASSEQVIDVEALRSEWQEQDDSPSVLNSNTGDASAAVMNGCNEDFRLALSPYASPTSSSRSQRDPPPPAAAAVLPDLTNDFDALLEQTTSSSFGTLAAATSIDGGLSTTSDSGTVCPPKTPQKSRLPQLTTTTSSSLSWSPALKAGGLDVVSGLVSSPATGLPTSAARENGDSRRVDEAVETSSFYGGESSSTYQGQPRAPHRPRTPVSGRGREEAVDLRPRTLVSGRGLKEAVDHRPPTPASGRGLEEAVGCRSGTPASCRGPAVPAGSPDSPNLSVTALIARLKQSSAAADSSTSPGAPGASKLHKCELCSEMLLGPRALEEHRAVQHVPPLSAAQLKCRKCNVAFPSLSELVSHRDIHKRLQIHSCQFCKKKYVHAQTLIKHVRQKHSGFAAKLSC